MPICRYSWMKHPRSTLPSVWTHTGRSSRTRGCCLKSHPPQQFFSASWTTFARVTRCVYLPGRHSGQRYIWQRAPAQLQQSSPSTGDSWYETKEGIMHFLVSQSRLSWHGISSKGLEPEASKVATIINAPAHRNLTQLRSLLGLVNYSGSLCLMMPRSLPHFIAFWRRVCHGSEAMSSRKH